MRANEKYFIRFLESSDTNFVIPVYQRNYDWKIEQCKQLYDDLVNMIKNNYNTHFLGAIVSIYNDNGKNREYFIIDGQQRITTISLILLAIYDILHKGLLKSETIFKEKIINQYLINQYCGENNKIKLKPIKDDREAYKRVFIGEDFDEESNITRNYKYFHKRILGEEISIDELYSTIERLMIVEIELKNVEDDPQLIFESLNSTGLDLTDADKVRNFILMKQSASKQEELYNNYWSKVEKCTGSSINEFLRDYLTMKESKIPKINSLYVSFKKYIIENKVNVEVCLKDMVKYGKYYRSIIDNNVGLKEVDDILKRINKLEVTVAYPFFLGLVDDYYEGIIDKDTLINTLSTTECYIFRRIVCKVPTNALNKVFMNIQKDIKKVEDFKENYFDIFRHILGNKKSSQRFPKNDEFKRSFLENDFYNMNSKNKIYLLERLENYNNVEKVDVENLVNAGALTIEHVMPQNLSKQWEQYLGDKAEEIHNKYLHTIGNLTLTGYNSSMSNKSFIEKREMKNGFKESRLRLNKYLAEQEEWKEENIVNRAEELYSIAAQIWKYNETKYEIEENNENLFSLADEDDFTNTKVWAFEFKGEKVKVKNWTQLFERICLQLYELDHIPFLRLVSKKFSNDYIGKRFSKNEGSLRAGFKISEGLYVEKNLNTEAKLNTLRTIFSEYGIDSNELNFYIK